MKVRIWDLPTRLFHWLLALLIIGSWCTMELAEPLGMDLSVWHARIGYSVLTLILFRILWGFFGGRYARFASFVLGPGAVLAYLRGGKAGGPGHNPLGALSVLALLFVVLLQACTGLFSNDDIAFEGPLAKLVSNALSGLMTKIHHINFNVLLVLVVLHLAAIIWYRLRKREKLVKAMLTGDKELDDGQAGVQLAADGATLRIGALALLALCAGFVYWLVHL
ncbi:MAG: cytochrome b/b6 domain-containing protein [Candidatus Protistobacter heckmanni]|nr:cytochrome b/b6 domain-containing protein [Candidatus Protistobacter heckmanni]